MESCEGLSNDESHAALSGGGDVTKDRPGNMAASVRQRLMSIAGQDKICRAGANLAGGCCPAAGCSPGSKGSAEDRQITLSPRARYATTLRKLPIVAPKAKNQRPAESSSEAVQTCWISCRCRTVPVFGLPCRGGIEGAAPRPRIPKPPPRAAVRMTACRCGGCFPPAMFVVNTPRIANTRKEPGFPLRTTRFLGG